MKKFLPAIFCLVLFSAPALASEVTITHHTFDVDGVTIKVGDAVVFSNKDNATYNIQVMDAHGNIDDKGLQKPGQDIQEVFMTPGEYRVRDGLHPKMAMRVTVQPQPNGPTVTSR